MSDALIPSNALETLMRKVFLENAIEAGLFWDALLKSNLYVPLAEDKPKEKAEEVPLETPDGFPMLLGVDGDGNNIVWLFTSPAIMKEYLQHDYPHLEIGATEILSHFEETRNDVVLIGPDQLTLKLHPKLIASLAEGKVPEGLESKNMAKESKVFVGPATEDAAALESRFKELFNSIPEVMEAVFIQVADDAIVPATEDASATEPANARLLLGLRLQTESREEFQRIAQLIAKASEGVLDKGRTMDITLIDGSLKEAFSKFGKAFFTR